MKQEIVKELGEEHILERYIYNEIDELIEFLQNAKKEGATHISVSNKYEEEITMQPVLIREETDAEYGARALLESMKMTYEKNQQYELYLRLKKQFEP